jgi:hypothetical protein
MTLNIGDTAPDFTADTSTGKTLGSDMGVASTRVLADGALELTLADGSVRIYAAGDFVVLEGGGIAVSGAVAAELTALAGAVSVAGVAAGALAGLLGAIAVAGVGPEDTGVNDVAVDRDDLRGNSAGGGWARQRCHGIP